MTDADVSQKIRRKIVGHETTEMNNIHTHHKMQKLALEVGKLPSVARQADCDLLSFLRPRFTFSRISAAVAVQMNGLGSELWVTI